MDPLDAICDPQLSDDELVRQVAALGPVVEPAARWNDIAGDARYRPGHRAQAIVQLFRRHVLPGTAIDGLVDATWLDRSSLATVDGVAGKLPLAYDPRDTVAVLGVVPELVAEISAIYLRLAGRLTRDQILAGLARSAPVPIAHGYAIIGGDGATCASAP